MLSLHAEHAHLGGIDVCFDPRQLHGGSASSEHKHVYYVFIIYVRQYS